MAKKEEMKAIPSEIEQKIESLTFYIENYLRSAKQTISYAIPAFVNEVNGSSATLGEAIRKIERVESLAERRIDELRFIAAKKAEIAKAKAKEVK